MKELILENRRAIIWSQQFHNDSKLEMTVREWLRIEEPDFYHDFFSTYAKMGQMLNVLGDYVQK
jgi:hypothetical protein